MNHAAAAAFLSGVPLIPSVDLAKLNGFLISGVCRGARGVEHDPAAQVAHEEAAQARRARRDKAAREKHPSTQT